MRASWVVLTVVAGAMATPAFASAVVGPAPVAGVGIGAVILMGIGYRALRRRIDR